MTTFPYPVLTISAERTQRGVLLRLAGELDYESAGELLDAVRAHLPGIGPDGLRLDCGELTACDSTGLSVLLMSRRLTTAAGVALHLDNRRPPLQRMLEITGTLAHLTVSAAPERQEASTHGSGAQHTARGPRGARGSRPDTG
ncbi:STAS domain-containing protein [Streptomyces sp. NBC_01497]|uniref:STAS domain-containing protein n=1 Tax=Streptomyces sp. NBC_01497 TaxID=2903885 RepID=UPI002E2FF27C|nr:STAS domain-containing protein [Streptomyces sp. NBC_01497]